MRDDSSSPRPVESQAAPLIQPDPSPLTANRRELDAEYPVSPPPSPLEPPRSESKPLVQGFKRPSPSRIAIHTALSFIAYPVFYILTLVAKDKSLFIVRLLVSIWCSGVGFALGYILLAIGAQHLEAASEFTAVRYRDVSETSFQTAWATVTHMSYEGGGMKLRDLARGSRNSTGFVPAFHVLRSRFGNRETARRSRKSYESVFGSPSILRLLTSLQQTTMDPLPRILRRPRHPGSPVTLHIRTHHRDQPFRERTCNTPPPCFS